MYGPEDWRRAAASPHPPDDWRRAAAASPRPPPHHGHPNYLGDRSAFPSPVIDSFPQRNGDDRWRRSVAGSQQPYHNPGMAYSGPANVPPPSDAGPQQPYHSPGMAYSGPANVPPPSDAGGGRTRPHFPESRQDEYFVAMPPRPPQMEVPDRPVTPSRWTHHPSHPTAPYSEGGRMYTSDVNAFHAQRNVTGYSDRQFDAQRSPYVQNQESEIYKAAAYGYGTPTSHTRQPDYDRGCHSDPIRSNSPSPHLSSRTRYQQSGEAWRNQTHKPYNSHFSGTPPRPRNADEARDPYHHSQEQRDSSWPPPENPRSNDEVREPQQSYPSQRRRRDHYDDVLEPFQEQSYSHREQRNSWPRSRPTEEARDSTPSRRGSSRRDYYSDAEDTYRYYDQGYSSSHRKEWDDSSRDPPDSVSSRRRESKRDRRLPATDLSRREQLLRRRHSVSREMLDSSEVSEYPETRRRTTSSRERHSDGKRYHDIRKESREREVVASVSSRGSFDRQLDHCDYPEVRSNPSQESSPLEIMTMITLKVRAREDVPDGQKFLVRVNGKSVKARVPRGGVKKGEIFLIRVPYDPTEGEPKRSRSLNAHDDYKVTARMGDDRTIIATVTKALSSMLRNSSDCIERSSTRPTHSEPEYQAIRLK